jgi:hypothetical protein
MCSKDLETSSQGVVASKLANADESIICYLRTRVYCETYCNQTKGKKSFDFFHGTFFQI